MKLTSIQLSNKKTYCILLVLMTLFLFLRAFDITSDPPPDLSISGALYSDEGFKTFAARNKTLYGDWKWTPIDGYDAWLTKSPLSIYTYTRVFSLIGVSLSSIRMISVTYAMATLVLLFFFVRHFFGNLPALAATAIMGFNYFNLMSSRLGFYEIHLNFFLMTACAVFGFMATSRSFIKNIIFTVIALCAIAATWYIKRSILIIVLALIPVLSIYLLRARGKDIALQRRAYYLIAGAGLLFYLIFAHSAFLHELLQKSLHTIRNGSTIANYIPFMAFSPLPVAVVRSLYLEFIFLQPVVFFLSFTYGIYSLYRLIRGMEVHGADAVLSAWLVFGFLLLIIMRYQPARYFIIISLPAAVLCMRALFNGLEDIADFLMHPPAGMAKIALNAYKVFLMLAAGVAVMVLASPFSVRLAAIKKITGPISEGRIIETLPVLAPYIIAEVLVAVFIFINRKRIPGLLKHRSAAAVLAACMLLLHFGQYGAWLMTRRHLTRDLSARLGQNLPANAILAGSWSAQLTLENSLRSLIMQDKGLYNHDVMEKILRNEPVPARSLGNRGLTMEKDLPLYLAICPDVVFEQTIKQKYRQYIKEENLIDSAGLGYFDIKVYRLRK